MKPTTKLFIKNILVTGLIFSLGMSIYDLVVGNDINIWVFLFTTIFFGLTMSLFFVPNHIDGLKKYGVNNLTDENLKAIQSDQIISSMKKETFIEKLMELKIFKKAKLIQREGGLTIRTKNDESSMGEVITIIVQPVKESTYKYSIVSKPKNPLALVNGGNGYAQVQELRKLLEH